MEHIAGTDYRTVYVIAVLFFIMAVDGYFFSDRDCLSGLIITVHDDVIDIVVVIVYDEVLIYDIEFLFDDRRIGNLKSFLVIKNKLDIEKSLIDESGHRIIEIKPAENILAVFASDDRNLAPGFILVSEESGIRLYYTKKNTMNTPDKLSLRKYDPVLRKHVVFTETKKNLGRNEVKEKKR